MDDAEFIDLGLPLPVFALPNAVLFPQVALQLHLFDAGHLTLAQDALDGQKAIAIALLRDGWDRDDGRHPPIHPTVCVGRIIGSKLHDDGRHDVILVGICRARITAEDASGPYRKALVEVVKPVEDTSSPGQDRLKLEMGKALNQTVFEQIEDIGSLRKLASTDLAAGSVADVLAHRLLHDAALKQRLLEELDVEVRVEGLVDELHTLGRILEAARLQRHPDSLSGPALN